MKKISVLLLSLTIAVLGLVSLNSCTQSPDSLAQDIVEEFNKQKAAYSQGGMELEEAKLDGKKIVMTLKMPVEFGAMKETIETSLKSQLTASALSTQFGSVDVLKTLIEGGYSFVYCYKDSTGDSIDVEISNADLKSEIK